MLTVHAQNVGIGTTSPDASSKLEIASDNSGLLIPRITEVQRSAIMSPATGLNALYFNTTVSGNTAIGEHRLLANTIGDFNTALGAGADVVYDSLTNATAIGRNAKVSTSNGLMLGGTGAFAVNVGIGTTAPAQVLSVNGDVSKVGGAVWLTFSDRRVKKEIRKFDDGLDVLMQIDSVYFRYNGKAGYEDDGKEYVGVIAQDVQKCAPYMIEMIRKKLNEDDQK